MSNQEQEARDRQRAWMLLAAVEDNPKVQEWLREADAAGRLDRKRSGTRTRVRMLTTRRSLWAAAAGVALTIGAAGAVYHYFGAQHYETRIGEQRDVLLPDGSRITLNTNTAVAVRYSRAAREIELQRGEALFAVKHNSTQPFEVSAGQTLTRAVGTEFNVDLRKTGVTVSVLEGSVRVSALTDVRGTAAATQSATSSALMRVAVDKGEALEFRAQERRLQEEKADLKRIDAWRARRLEFSNTRLAEAIEEFNRYSTTHIEVGTPELESVRVSGIFRTGDAAGFLYSLQQALGVQTHESVHGVVLTRPVSGT